MILAFILIFFGIVLLLANFDVVSWSVFADLWRLWPVLLVVWGLQLIFGRTQSGRIVAGIITAAVFMYLLLALAVSGSSMFRGWIGDDAARLFPMHMQRLDDDDFERTTQTVPSVSDTDVTARELTFSIGAAELTLEDDESLAASLEVEGPANRPLDVESSTRGGTFKLKAETPSQSWLWLGSHDWKYVATLGQSTVPTELAIKLGASKAAIDLSATRLTKFDLDLGAGTVAMQLAGDALAPKATIDVGAGSVTLLIPKNRRVQVRYDVGAGQVRIGAQSFRGSGSYLLESIDAVPTTDSSTQTEVMDIEVGVGAGTVTIDHQ